MTLHVCKHSNLLCSVIFVNFFYNFFNNDVIVIMSSLDSCQHRKLLTGSRLSTGVFTPPTRRNSTVSSRRSRRCVLDIKETQCLCLHRFLMLIFSIQFLGTCETSRFDLNSKRPGRFDSKVIDRFENFRIESAVPAPLLVASLSTTQTINGT